MEVTVVVGMKDTKKTVADGRMIPVAELAERWSVDRHTVVRLLDEAGVRPYYLSQKVGGTKRYLDRDIEQFLQSCHA